MTAPGDEPLHPALPSGLRLGAPFGITLRLHWSFLLLGGWLALSTLDRTGSPAAVFALLVLTAVVFGSVALHEYGHALTARRFGIGTREITLLPFGGIAQLERSPTDPLQELWIALAGPLVNFVLAGLALGGMLLSGDAGALRSEGMQSESILGFAVYVNLFMGVFNLLPALPMDGGRVLRAALAMRLPAIRATRIATTVAKVLAGGMMAYGMLAGHLMLAVIGGFVWITAGAELRRVEVEAVLRERARRMAQAGFTVPFGPDFETGARPPGDEWHQPDDDEPPPDVRVVGTGTTRRR